MENLECSLSKSNFWLYFEELPDVYSRNSNFQSKNPSLAFLDNFWPKSNFQNTEFDGKDNNTRNLKKINEIPMFNLKIGVWHFLENFWPKSNFQNKGIWRERQQRKLGAIFTTIKVIFPVIFKFWLWKCVYHVFYRVFACCCCPSASNSVFCFGHSISAKNCPKMPNSDF